MKNKKLKMSEIMGYAEKYILDKEDEKIVFYWYNPKYLEFIYVDELKNRLGKYSYNLFEKEGFIPVDQVDVLQLEKEFIKSLQSDEIHKSFDGLEGEDLYISFNKFIMDDYIEYSYKWSAFLKESLIGTMLEWLHRNIHITKTCVVNLRVSPML